MANETINAKHNSAPVSMGADVIDGVEISQIGYDTEWNLTTTDVDGTVVVTPFVGPAPKKRNQ